MYTMRDVLEIDADRFWQVYFDEAFGRALHCDLLQFASFEIAEQRRDEHGVLHRRVEYRPKLTGVSKMIVKPFGDGAYAEHGRYEPPRRMYTAEYVPKQGGETLITHTELQVLPLSDGRCDFVLTVTNRTKLRGLKWLVESTAEQLQWRAHADMLSFLKQWIRERGLGSTARGAASAIDSAVD